MPELPEVEVTRRQVAPLLEGRRIVDAITTGPSSFFLTPPHLLRRRLRGRSVRELHRHGKYLLARLDDESQLLLHLGMTGQLFAAGAASPRLHRVAERGRSPEVLASFVPDQHTHLQLRFADGGTPVLFRDVRRFGKVLHLAPGATSPRLERLGVDALEANAIDLWRRTRRRRVAVKTALLDQSLLAGVGNIYADETLFRAGLRPTRSVHDVSRAAWQRLIEELHLILWRSIEVGGTTVSDFVHPDGADGAYAQELLVYGREGAPCMTCGTAVKRLVLGGRSSHFCPTCQR